jgi:hypothetical protein
MPVWSVQIADSDPQNISDSNAGMVGDFTDNTTAAPNQTNNCEFCNPDSDPEHYVNSVNGYETFKPDIAKGDKGRRPQPEGITQRVADLLWAEYSIEVEDLSIEVINPEDDDVHVL